MEKKQHIVALVGMCGAGKSEVAERFVSAGYAYLRFGQITLDEVKRLGLEPKEENERSIREEFRAKHGMAAFAILNMPKIDTLIASGKNVLADGLYSWSEYKELRKRYGTALYVLAVYSPPALRYERLHDRASRHGADPKMRFRSFSKEEAESRDYAEIEKIEKAGPIAMADATLCNTGTLDDLHRKTDDIIKKLA